MPRTLILIFSLTALSALADDTLTDLKWLIAPPQLKVTVNGGAKEKTNVVADDIIRIEVTAKGRYPLEFKFLHHQLTYETLQAWALQSTLEYRVTNDDLRYPYLELLAEIKESYGYSYEPEPRAIYRALVHFGVSEPKRVALPASSLPSFQARTLSVNVAAKFNEEQRRFVEKAFQHYLDYAFAPPLLDCAWSTAARDVPWSKNAFQQEVVASLQGNLLLDGYRNHASLAHADRVWFRYENDYLSVGVNLDYLGSGSTKPISYFADSQVPQYAGILGHEVLHNFGFDHESGYTQDAGRFINAYEKCFETTPAQSRSNAASPSATKF